MAKKILVCLVLVLNLTACANMGGGSSTYDSTANVNNPMRGSMSSSDPGASF